MKRLRNWESKLNRAIEEMRAREYVVGESDCALMACDLVKAMTGVDPAETLRGTYDSLEDFADTFEDVCESIAEAMKLEEVEVSFAQRGDVCLFDRPKSTEGEPDGCLGVVDMTGRYVVFPQVNGGIARIPVARCKRAWRI